MQIQTWFGLGVLFFTGAVYLTLCLAGKKLDFVKPNTRFSAANQLKNDIENSLETGHSVHVDINGADGEWFPNPALVYAAEFAGITARKVSQSDQPFLTTSGNAMVAFSAKQAIADQMKVAELENEQESGMAVYCGADSILRQTMMISLLPETAAEIHINLGNHGAEIALQRLAFDENEKIFIGGENLCGVASGLACGDPVAIGEKYYEISEGLTDAKTPDAALVTADVLCTFLTATILFGVLINVFL